MWGDEAADKRAWEEEAPTNRPKPSLCRSLCMEICMEIEVLIHLVYPWCMLAIWRELESSLSVNSDLTLELYATL